MPYLSYICQQLEIPLNCPKYLTGVFRGSQKAEHGISMLYYFTASCPIIIKYLLPLLYDVKIPHPSNCHVFLTDPQENHNFFSIIRDHNSKGT